MNCIVSILNSHGIRTGKDTGGYIRLINRHMDCMQRKDGTYVLRFARDNNQWAPFYKKITGSPFYAGRHRHTEVWEINGPTDLSVAISFIKTISASKGYS
jgi:hypothetical protein